MPREPQNHISLKGDSVLPASSIKMVSYLSTEASLDISTALARSPAKRRCPLSLWKDPSPSSTMKIFHDLFTDDEVCTDANQMNVEKGLMKVTCKFVKRSNDLKCDTGANASQEEQGEEYEDSNEECGLDVCINHNLEDCTSYYDTAKSYVKYLKTYCKMLGKHYKKIGKADRLPEIMEAFNELKDIVTKNEDDIQFFKAPYKDVEVSQEDQGEDGEDSSPECFHIPAQRVNDKGDCVMFFFHAAVREEKV